MRVLDLFTAAILSTTALAAKKSSAAFDVFSKKQTPITLSEQTYAELTGAPRDYHAAVVLTALDAKYACGICREFQPEWDMLAKSWQKGDKKKTSRLLFGTLDFDQGKNVFMSVSQSHVKQREVLMNIVSTSNCASPLPVSSYHRTKCFTRC